MLFLHSVILRVVSKSLIKLLVIAVQEPVPGRCISLDGVAKTWFAEVLVVSRPRIEPTLDREYRCSNARDFLRHRNCVLDHLSLSVIPYVMRRVVAGPKDNVRLHNSLDIVYERIKSMLRQVAVVATPMLSLAGAV